MATGNIIGKTNIGSYKYSGKDTATANTTVDNINRTISVDVNVNEVTKDCATKNELAQAKNELNNKIDQKQDTLVSGVNIKTINGESILGSGDFTIELPDTVRVISDSAISINELLLEVGNNPFVFNNELFVRIHNRAEDEYNVYIVDSLSGGIHYAYSEGRSGDEILSDIISDIESWKDVATRNDLSELEHFLLNKDAELARDIAKVDEKVEEVSKQTKVYDYFYYSAEDNEITLPAKNTTYNFLEFSSKGISDQSTNCCIALYNNLSPVLDGEDNILSNSDIQESYFLYQTGVKNDIATNRYAYDTFDFNTCAITRYCYPLTFREFFALFDSTDFTWYGTTANGRLRISFEKLAEKGIYSENTFAIKYSRDIGLTYRGISATNFAIDNLKSITGITDKSSAIEVLSGNDYADVILVFKRTSPIEESTTLGILEGSADGTHERTINNFAGCLKASYQSLYDLVYSKDQADAKFQTIAEYVEQYASNDHIIKIGDLENDNKIIAASDIYQTLNDFGWPKVASAFCIEPEELESGEPAYTGELLPQFTHDTLFINSFDGTNYGYIVLSNKNIYWFRVDSRTDEVICESMLETSWDEIKEKPAFIENLRDSENDSLVQIPHFNEGLTWSSDDESVALVDQNGKVTAVGAGTATISVIDEYGKTASCDITVTNPSRSLISGRKGLLRGAVSTSTQYRLVSDANSLSNGDEIIIVATKNNVWYALSVNQQSSNRAATVISAPSGDVITISGNEDPRVDEITLTAVSGQTNQFNFGVDGGYLYASSSSANQLKTGSSIGNENYNWLISISDDIAVVTAQGSNTRNTMQGYFTSTSTVFNCYASTSSNTSLRIYKKVTGPEPAESVSITGPDTLIAGTSAQLTATVYPSTASQEITWSTSDSSIIDVDTQEGEVRAAGNIGESATITATVVSDPTITASITITIVEEPTIITSVIVTPDVVSGLSYGETQQLSAEVEGTGPGVTQDVTWASGDSQMATVDQTGLVTIGNKPGLVIITATSDVDPNVHGDCEVTVDQVMVESVTLDPENPNELTLGLDYSFNYSIAPSYAYDKSVEWSSSDDTKVSVNNGVVSALEITSEPVTITVTALDGSGEFDSVNVTVVEPLGRLYLDVESLSLKVGETYQLTCSDIPFNNVSGRSSAAFGYGNEITHDSSFALGSNLTSTADNQVLVGTHNDTSSTAAFQVGAGDGHTGFNAFEVSASGKAKAGAATESTDSANTLVTKGYAESTFVARTRSVSILTSDWDNSAVTLDLSPVTVGVNDVLFVSPSDDCAQEYYNCGIQRIVSGSSLTLTASTLPENTITIQIVYFKGEAF